MRRWPLHFPIPDMPSHLSTSNYDIRSPSPYGPGTWLAAKETHLKAERIEDTSNSKYKCAKDVPLDKIQVWENFLDRNSINEIYDFLLQNPIIHRKLCENLAPDELADFPWGRAIQGRILNEQAFERQWGHVISGINRIIMICNAAVQNEENPICCIIGD